MPITTPNFGELLEIGLRKIYGDSYPDYEEEFSKVFDVQTSTKANEDELSMTGFGLVPTKDEGGSISYDTAYEGFKKTYTHVTYGLGFIVTREMVEDDQYRKIAALPNALKRSVSQSVEILAATVLNNAFTSGTLSDGSYLCATGRVLEAGGTWQNRPTTAADFSVTALEQAYIDIANYVDGRGLKMKAMPQKLIITTTDAWNANVILASAQMPGTANNDINPARNVIPGGVQVMHYLTDTDAWFLKTDVPNGLTFFWRRRPEFTRDNDFDTENAKFKTTFRCSVGATDARGIYGNPGA